MHLARIDQLCEGMVLSRDILDSLSGRVLLSKGVVLKKPYIEGLKKLNIYAVYIEKTPGFAPFMSQEPMPKGEMYQTVGSALDAVSLNKNIRLRELKEEILFFIDEIISNGVVSLCITEIKDHDEYTKRHSFNVAILSILIGLQLGLKKEELVELGTGAVLHDVGKMFIRCDLLNKKERLSTAEFNEIRRHSQYGYDILEHRDDLSAEAKNVVRDHHERMNGSGYPSGMIKEQIGFFSKIVMVADVYDAMTAKRVYKKALTPYEGAGIIKSMSGLLFDRQVTDAFLSLIAPYPIGCMVRLSDGKIGVVTKNDPNDERRIGIRLVYDEKGIMYRDTYEFFLGEQNQLEIVGIA